MDPKDVATAKPEQTLDYFVQRRNGNKRNYIFDYGKAKTCPHSDLKEVAVGSGIYRCVGEDGCNYALRISAAEMWPMHFLPILGAFEILNFAKEFGQDALQEVLRRPIGQYDDAPHKPVLPDGMSFMDVLAALEDVDVNSLDGGADQLKALMEAKWSVYKQTPISNNKPLSLTESNDDADQETNAT